MAHKLKYKYGMNPLCVTWSPLIYTDIGRENLDNFIKSGFNHILGTPDPVVTRKLTQLSFKEMGDPFQPFIYGQQNFPLNISLKYNIPLIMYGENGEVEYGGDMRNAFKAQREIKDQEKHYFSSINPEAWAKFGLSIKELYPFLPHIKLIKNKTEIHFMDTTIIRITGITIPKIYWVKPNLKSKDLFEICKPRR